jgi:CRISPR-associated protein Csm3
MMSIRLLKYKKIKGQIKLVTGLHIGGSKDEIRIGETDNPVIKSPIDGFPYIPGSSLKGKIRTLLEWYIPGKVMKDGDVHGCKDASCPICRLFGSSEKETTAGPGRVLFRDCVLDKNSKGKLDELKNETGLMYVEEKYENVIDRTKGSTKKGGLRQMERVPAGMIFDFEMDYRVFDMGDKGKTDEDYFYVILKGLELLQNDALGGSGSRGYGQIVFENLTDENGKPIDLQKLIMDESLEKIVK